MVLCVLFQTGNGLLLYCNVSPRRLRNPPGLAVCSVRLYCNSPKRLSGTGQGNLFWRRSICSPLVDTQQEKCYTCAGNRRRDTPYREVSDFGNVQYIKDQPGAECAKDRGSNIYP